MSKTERIAARKARRAARKAARQDRRADRRARRAARRERRQEIRAQRRANKSRLQDKIMEKVDTFLDHEFEKIKAEYQAKEEAGKLQPNPHLTIKEVSEALRAAQASGEVTLTKTEQTITDMVLLGEEIANKFKEQMRVVYEVAVANGYKTDDLPKEVIIYIMLNALTKRAFDRNIIKQDGVIRVKAFMDSPEARKSVARVIAVHLAKKALKSLVAKFLPGIGDVMLNLFKERYLENVYFQSKELLKDQPDFSLDKDGVMELIEQSANVAAEAEVDNTPEDDDEVFTSFMVLINLMQEDGHITDQEKATFAQMLDASDLDDEDKADIRASLENPDEVDDSELESIEDGSDEAEAILMDMIAIAKSDTSVNLQEAEYIYEIAGELGFEEASVKQMLLS